MLGKHYARVGLWAIPLVALALAGCNKQSRPSPSAAENSGSPATPAANATIDPATAGSVSGTIRFNGKAPMPIVIDMAQDPACSGGSKTPNMTEQYVVHDGRLANVFLYVKDGLGNRIYMPTKAPVVLDQKGCRYIPHVIGAMVGQPVEFRNSDRTMHNVHIAAAGERGQLRVRYFSGADGGHRATYLSPCRTDDSRPLQQSSMDGSVPERCQKPVFCGFEHGWDI